MMHTLATCSLFTARGQLRSLLRSDQKAGREAAGARRGFVRCVLSARGPAEFRLLCGGFLVGAAFYAAGRSGNV